MNDATEPVDAAPWLAPEEAADAAGPAGLSSEAAEVEFDGRRWEIPTDVTGSDEPLTPAVPVEVLDPNLAAFEGVDWRGWAARDPQAAGLAWQAFCDLTAAHQQARDAEAADRAQRLQAAHAELARDIEGWSPQLAADLAAYGQARGFTRDELAAVEDPREIKILHLAMLGEQALARQGHEQRFGRFRPPTQVGGRGHPGHLPSDRNSTDAWMQARRSQLRKKARG